MTTTQTPGRTTYPTRAEAVAAYHDAIRAGYDATRAGAIVTIHDTTPSTIARRTGQPLTRHDLERELRDRREAALAAYRERGVDVYLDNAALRGDLALLLSLADEDRAALTMTLAEVNGLRTAGLMDAAHTLTPAGAEAAAAALIVRGL